MKPIGAICAALAMAVLSVAARTSPHVSLDPNDVGKPPVTRWPTFNGDYSGLATVGDVAHPLWSDARNQAPPALNGPGFQDEDVFTDAVAVPRGRGSGEGEGEHR